jgi:Tfp pilus assembly protein PilP
MQPQNQAQPLYQDPQYRQPEPAQPTQFPPEGAAPEPPPVQLAQPPETPVDLGADIQIPELSGPQMPDDPEAIPVYNELERFHRDVLAAYMVNVTTMPDPFMPIETVARPPEQEVGPTQDLRRLPMIQRLALNQFTLTAIVEAPNPNNNTALVDSGGIGYLIQKGSKIGPNNGYVRDITSTKVVIEEPEVNFRGERSTRIFEMNLNTLENSIEIEGDGSEMP